MMAKEFRGRMRSWHSLVIIMVYLTALVAIGFGTIINLRDSGRNTGLEAAAIGPLIFGALAEFQLILIAFVAPALTGAAIAGEKERQTYDLLLVTRLSSFSIVMGKLFTSLAYLLLLLFISMPVYMLAFLFGGVNLGEFALTQLILVVTGLALGSLALAISVFVPKPQIATALAYVLSFALVLGSGIFGSLTANAAINNANAQPTAPNIYYDPYQISALPPPPLLTGFSPLAAVATSVTTPFGAAVNISFFQLPTGLPDAYFNYSSYNGGGYSYGGKYGGNGGLFPNSNLPSTANRFLAIYGGIIIISLGLSMLFVRPRRWFKNIRRGLGMRRQTTPGSTK